MEEFANASYLLNERWFITPTERRPITAKSASTLDGFICGSWHDEVDYRYRRAHLTGT